MNAFNFLSQLGFSRAHCPCGTWFWHPVGVVDGCGQCSKISKARYQTQYTGRSVDTAQFRRAYTTHYQKRGYQLIPPRSVRLSRGNIRYVNAGICIYTPHFMNGVAIPGYGTKLISFQPCIRFKDAHLVGETTRHLTNFIMVGQHVFEVALFEPDWIRQRFIELYQFFLQYLTNQQGLYIVNESVWTDNRNKGHSLQIYVAGLEIANQVYTTEHMDGTPLTYRYVDMGMGQARFIQVANKLSNVYAVLGYTQSCRLKDYLRTVALAHGDGIYCSKKNVGYNLRRLVQRLFQEYGYQAVARAVAQQYPALSHALQREHHLWRT